MDKKSCMIRKILSINLLFLTAWAICSACARGCPDNKAAKADTPGQNDTLPPPYDTKSVRNFSRVIAWPNGRTPIAPAGFTVTKFADGLDNPRWIYIGSNGDIFVA